MKKFLTIIVLGLLFSGDAYADNLPTKLFGIEIYGNIEDYAKKDSGKKYPNRKGIISFNESEYKFFNITRSNLFDKYMLRSDEEFKILVITGGFQFLVLNKYDRDMPRCRHYKNEFIKMISNDAHYDVNQNSFKQKYYKADYKSNHMIIDSSQLSYRKKFNKLILQVYCVYLPISGGTEKQDGVQTILYFTLMDKNYFKDYTLKLWKEIDDFEKERLFKSITGYSDDKNFR